MPAQISPFLGGRFPPLAAPIRSVSLQYPLFARFYVCPRVTEFLTLTLSTDNANCRDVLTNAVTIGTSMVESVYTDNVAHSQPVTVVGPDVTLTKTVAPAEMVNGGTVTYTLVYSNVGRAAAEGVVVRDGADSWPVGTLQPGDSGSRVFTRTITGNCGDWVTNIATIETSTPECGNEPNTASASVEIIGPDVTVTKTATMIEVLRGGLLNYVITYNNIGDAVAQNVEITDNLPAGTTYVSNNSGMACTGCALGGFGPLVWDANTLLSGVGGSFTLVLRVNNTVPCSTTLAGNIATITTTTPECDATNNGDQSGPVHVIGADVTIAKTTAITQAGHGD